MTVELFTLGLFAQLLPWLSGVFLANAILPSKYPGRTACVVGHGFGLGWLLTSWLLRASDLAFGQLSVYAVSVVLVLCCGASLTRFFDSTKSQKFSRLEMQARETDLPLWSLVGLGVLSVFILASSMIEATQQPLLAWDAWNHWGAKAKAWYFNGEIIPFLSPADWAAHESTLAYRLQGTTAHPPTVPLVMTWPALWIGDWRVGWTVLAWPLCGISLALAIAGFARAAKAPTHVALAAGLVPFALPYFSIHMALPGYADLWMSLYITLAFGSLYMALGGGRRRWYLLFAVYALFLTQIKLSGLAWMALLSALAIFGRWPRFSVACGASVTLALLIVAVTWGPSVPLFGREFAITEFRWTVPAIVDLWFLGSDWSLLWFLYFAAVGTSIWILPPGLDRQWLIPATGALVLLLLLAFQFTTKGQPDAIFQTLNRATLHVIGPIIFFLAVYSKHLLVVTHRWSARG